MAHEWHWIGTMNSIAGFEPPNKNTILLFSVAIEGCSYFDISVLEFFYANK